MAVKFNQLTKSQQGLARRLFDRASAVGLSAPSVTQVGLNLREWVARVAAAEEAAKPKTIKATAKDVAMWFGISVRTVQRRAKAGKFAATKDVRGHWIITLPAK